MSSNLVKRNEETPIQYTESGNKVVSASADGKTAEVIYAEVNLFNGKEPLIISYKQFLLLREAMKNDEKYAELPNGDMIAISNIASVRQKITTEQSIDEKRTKQIQDFRIQWQNNRSIILTTDSKGNNYMNGEFVQPITAEQFVESEKKALEKAITEKFGNPV